MPSLSTVELSPVPGAPRLAIHDAHDPARPRVERFIRNVFSERFGARLKAFAPVLVSASDEDGEIVAAAGYRAADSGPLFLEHYLDEPVETVLAAAHGAMPLRARIAEVGHLAAARPGEGRRLILAMAPYLAAQGFEWVVSTLTDELRQLFVRIGVAPLALGRADPQVLGEAAADWGSYYEHRPVVLAGHVPLALRHLKQRGLIRQEAAA